MADFEKLQLALVGSLKSSFANAAAQDNAPAMLPALSDVLDGLPFYQAPDWTAAFRQALAQVLALNLPDMEMAFWSTSNDMAHYPQGYRDAFYSGVGADGVTNALTSLTSAAAPALTSDWWSNYSVAVLVDAVRIYSTDQPPINLGKLAGDLASFNGQITPGLWAAVSAVLEQGYPPTTQPFGLLQDHEDIAVSQLTAAIKQGTFTGNVNEGVETGGDAATAAIWFLYELWLLLAAFRASNVDLLIQQFSGEGLQVPAQVGPGAWRTYASWHPPLGGNDVLPVAIPVINATMPDVANPGYVIHHGYSYSLACYGALNRYWQM